MTCPECALCTSWAVDGLRYASAPAAALVHTDLASCRITLTFLLSREQYVFLSSLCSVVFRRFRPDARPSSAKHRGEDAGAAVDRYLGWCCLWRNAAAR